MPSGPSTSDYHERAEDTPLLPQPQRRNQDRQSNAMGYSLAYIFRWKPHPYWLIPVVLVMSMSRGVTMSPRIQVYKAIACRTLSSDSPGVGSSLTEIINTTTQCGDTDVQAKAAKIQAAVVTLMSALSAITTGFWSRRGDTHGRKPFYQPSSLRESLIDVYFREAVFVLVMKPDSWFGRYGEKAILVGPILEGLVGGLSTFNGVVHAYISDCTRHGSRSKIFSTVQGMVFVGLAIGPPFAGVLLPQVGYSDSFFYTSITLIFLTLLYVNFVCPESFIPVERETIENIREEEQQSKSSAIYAARRLITRFLSALLSPILIRKLNYGMPLVGLSLFLYLVSTGVYSAKYLYAQHVFTWNTAELGYYMSILWITRAFNLLNPNLPTAPGSSPNAHDVAAELKFDRYLAQISVGLDGLADSLVALTASRSQPFFVALSCLSSFTSGAIALHACGYSSEVGTLFGAMSVLSAVAHIISPSIYAGTYSRTVGSFPEAILVRADENEIEMIHGNASSRSRRTSVDERRPFSGSYDYDAIPAYEEGHGNEHEEDERRRVSAPQPDGGSPLVERVT
ncbi:hypothetical protein DFP72DRAFT_1125319 [Ephemerocybe angulata]|uniref:Uncharacterized protein n=1 Tax=Ephemerocybe angulata TaxID=980116 RepID=A0A8H6M3T6_9AGAR|nr:hypothetical protein DFP72DRAFT_1125319 [Tulosesus angulatus]